MMSSKTQDGAKLTAHFRQAKPAAPAPAKKPATRGTKRGRDVPEPAAVERSTGEAAVNRVDLSEEEQLLRKFDLNSKFGPCAGMSRLERWQRAERFGLGPPEDVQRVLLAKAQGDAAHKSLWDAKNI